MATTTKPSTKPATTEQPAELPADVQQVTAQGPSLLEALEVAAAKLVQQLPSQATGKPRHTPTILPAGSPDAVAALSACTDRYGEPLEPLTQAEGYRHLIGGRKPEAPQPRRRQNTATILAGIVHAAASQPEGLEIDQLYGVILHARQHGAAGLAPIKPGTGPVQILAIACQEKNCGFYVEANRLYVSDHKIGKPGSCKWLRVES
jgi:hypothetical protein